MWTRHWEAPRQWCLARPSRLPKPDPRTRIFKSLRFLNPLPGSKLRAPLEMRHLSSIPR
ncbi:protein of unknown function (plasmid) [Cupriavidus neocaledonicus]|uniref:Uncharacterized protein n=1 Tax=Cupriavidus neocaledonicus TaxID=1040979 RepID=A0A375HVT5_9BURK|nr:hypothetical protein CBM2605_B50047 [Cupriavidus neocaledonicus]SPD60790.1 protein of unknown function [Cupriavidus neocaledonicus]